MKEILKLDHIQKFYGNEGNVTKAIQDIDFSVQEGEFLGIMGASGSGKTTMLNCISTIDTVSAGHIYLDGTDVTEIKEKAIAKFRRENLGFIFQDFNLLDTLTISENIALALTINHIPVREIEPRVEEIAKKSEYCRYFGQISISGFRWTEAEMCLCQSNYQSPEADFGLTEPDRCLGQPLISDAAVYHAECE